MTNAFIKKSILSGEETIPSSKSETLRALLFASLAKGKSVIYNPLMANDTDAMIQACRIFGASINIFDTKLEVQGLNGRLDFKTATINAGNSGIVLRFCSSVGALSNQAFTVTGDHSICHQRPMQPLLDGLLQLGATAYSTKKAGYAPVCIKGPLKGGQAIVNGGDSQPISALLIASCFLEEQTELFVNNPGEKPWINLTLKWFDKLGVNYQNEKFKKYKVFGKNQYEGFSYSVPGDFSSAAFLLVASLITRSSITLKNLDMSSNQGDKEIIAILKKMGADFEIDACNKMVHVKKCQSLQGICLDVNDVIDAIPILAVLGCYAEGKTHLYNGAIARQKECNRLSAIAQELKKMNASIAETEDGLIIQNSKLTGTTLFSHNDHRIAMALSVAALGANGETIIKACECISKTFPTFFSTLKKMGAQSKIYE